MYEIITQAGSAFAAGNVVYRSAGSFILAKADIPATADAVGVIQSAIGTTFTVVYAGDITGLSGLVDGTWYFVSDTVAGELMPDPGPTTFGHVNKPVLIATGTTTGFISLQRGEILEPAMQSPFQNVVSTSTSLVMTTNNGTVLVNAAISSLTITLPTATGALTNSYIVKRIDANPATNVTVISAGGNIENQSSWILGGMAALQVVSDGSSWWLV